MDRSKTKPKPNPNASHPKNSQVGHRTKDPLAMVGEQTKKYPEAIKNILRENVKKLETHMFQANRLQTAFDKLSKHKENKTLPKSLRVHSKVMVNKTYQNEVNAKMTALNSLHSSQTLDIILETRKKELETANQAVNKWTEDTLNKVLKLVELVKNRFSYDSKLTIEELKPVLLKLYEEKIFQTAAKHLKFEEKKLQIQQNKVLAQEKMSNMDVELTTAMLVQKEVQRQVKKLKLPSKNLPMGPIHRSPNSTTTQNKAKDNNKNKKKPKSKPLSALDTHSPKQWKTFTKKKKSTTNKNKK